jgi:hypothetical protein
MGMLDWFKANPRRLCVLGVWLHAAGLAAMVYGWAVGHAITGSVLAVALLTAAAVFKSTGLGMLKRSRHLRPRSAANRSALNHVAPAAVRP